MRHKWKLIIGFLGGLGGKYLMDFSLQEPIAVLDPPWLAIVIGGFIGVIIGSMFDKKERK